MAYAVAYPFGIIGIILTMLLIQKVFALNPKTEGIAGETATGSDDRTPDHVDLEVTNPNVDGLRLRDV
jgi:putative transport protein